jgi:hypothetical protein
LRRLVSAVLARGVCAVIPLFFYADEIAAAKMLLIFRGSAAMDILTKRGQSRSRRSSQRSIRRNEIVTHPIAANPTQPTSLTSFMPGGNNLRHNRDELPVH